MSTENNAATDAATISDSGTAGTPDQGAPAPTVKTDRLLGLDFTRGIAVLGILAANIVAFGQPMSAYMWPEAFLTPHGEISNWLWVLQFILIDGKMRGLFTLLFGAGLVLFMEKAWAKGATRWLQARRLLFLFMFGLIHFYLIWPGDILLLYAVVGIAAMGCLRWAARTQIIVGALGYVVGAIMFAAMMTFPYFVVETSFGDQGPMLEQRAELETTVTEQLADEAEEAEIHAGGSYAAHIAHRFTQHGWMPFINILMFSLETLPLMLLGMGLFRIGLFSGGIDPGQQRKIGWASLIFGTALTVPIGLWALNNGLTYWGSLAAFMGFSFLPRLFMVIGLAALLALWGATATGWLSQRFIAAGRMAFSNYLGTSIVMILIFDGWAGGLWGKLTRPELYLVVLGAWAVMLLWSKPWLEVFRYGPLEWLWRCLTYGRLFPLRR